MIVPPLEELEIRNSTKSKCCLLYHLRMGFKTIVPAMRQSVQRNLGEGELTR